MQINNISNQPKFTGQMVYINNKGTKYFGRINDFFSTKIQKELEEVGKMIKEKPYNLYITRSKKYPENIIFNANYNYKNIQRHDNMKRAIPVMVSEEKPDMIVAVAKAAMESFERTSIYTTNHMNKFKQILNNIVLKY